MRYGINRFYIHLHYLRILALLKLCINFLQKLRQLESIFDFDLNRGLEVVDEDGEEKLNSSDNSPSIDSNVFLNII